MLVSAAICVCVSCVYFGVAAGDEKVDGDACGGGGQGGCRRLGGGWQKIQAKIVGRGRGTRGHTLPSALCVGRLFVVLPQILVRTMLIRVSCGRAHSTARDSIRSGLRGSRFASPPQMPLRDWSARYIQYVGHIGGSLSPPVRSGLRVVVISLSDCRSRSESSTPSLLVGGTVQ